MRNKTVIVVVIFALVAALVLTWMLVKNRKVSTGDVGETPIDVDELKIQFEQGFLNQDNAWVSDMYHIEEEKSGAYLINADIPFVHISDEIDAKINKEINDIFCDKIVKTVNGSEKYTVIKMSYSSSVSNNIFSMAVKFVLKEGNTPQRTIIKTYNYDILNDKEITISDVVSNDKKNEIQTLINEKIASEIKREESIVEITGKDYNLYRRNPEDKMYLIDNVSEYYTKENILYIIYSYGNSNYTSEVDLVITKL